MKFVCMKCETFMLFQKVEKPGEESLGVMFECPSCASRFSMVTNAGETQLVSALGVKLGGRATAPEPFELTRGTLKDSAAASMGSAAAQAKPAAEEASGGSCPFSSMLSSMESGATVKPKWSEEALKRMDGIPEMIQAMVKGGIEAYAAQKGYQVITPAVIEESKSAMGAESVELRWSPGAQQRLDNIPSFIRPMAKKEIERMAREKGLSTVTDDMMDAVKEKFAQFMSMGFNFNK